MIPYNKASRIYGFFAVKDTGRISLLLLCCYNLIVRLYRTKGFISCQLFCIGLFLYQTERFPLHSMALCFILDL